MSNDRVDAEKLRQALRSLLCMLPSARTYLSGPVPAWLVKLEWEDISAARHALDQYESNRPAHELDRVEDALCHLIASIGTINPVVPLGVGKCVTIDAAIHRANDALAAAAATQKAGTQ